MERTELAAVLPVSFRWSDVGSWNAVWDAQPQDEAGNVIEGPAEVIDTRNSLIRSEDTVLTTVIGLEGVIVIATADAVLVVAQQQAEKVKDLVEQLKAKNRTEALEHRRVYRPWGFYQSADNGSRYQVKRICVNPGARLSLQKHFHRSEHWVVVRGVAEVTIGDDVKLYHENEFGLCADRRRPSPRQSRQDPAGADRGAGRQLSRRGRHPPPRGRLPSPR